MTSWLDKHGWIFFPSLNFAQFLNPDFLDFIWVNRSDRFGFPVRPARWPVGRGPMRLKRENGYSLLAEPMKGAADGPTGRTVRLGPTFSTLLFSH